MPTLRGRIVGLTWQSEMVCVYIGSSMNDAQLLQIQFTASDSGIDTEYKRLLAKQLTTALTSRRTVDVEYEGSLVGGIDFVLPNISPVGPAIPGDLYSVTGSNIPANAELVFESTTATVSVPADFRRPHWVLVEQVPAAVPAGPAAVYLRAAGWESDHVPIQILGGAPELVRTLYSGRPAHEPYTFVFAATPAVEGEGDPGAITADPVVADRPAFQDLVAYCLDNLFNVTESLLQGELEQGMRFVAVFDTNRPATTENALVHQVSPNLVETRRDRLGAFTSRYWERADLVFCVTANTTHTRASAWFTSDAMDREGVDFVYDGATRAHRRFTTIPGSAAIPTTVAHTGGLTPIHEFGHAASDFDNGKVDDLYVDGQRPGLVVNKKHRMRATAPVPAHFADLDGTKYNSDPSRDGLGYESGWTSYHPTLLDGTRPNMMDNYWLADVPTRCRLDGLTFQWFRDRLRAKVIR